MPTNQDAGRKLDEPIQDTASCLIKSYFLTELMASYQIQVDTQTIVFQNSLLRAMITIICRVITV
jgi:hypothetical protein